MTAAGFWAAAVPAKTVAAKTTVKAEIFVIAYFPVILTKAVADFVGSAALTAVTFTVPGDGVAPGALYRPVELMVPTTLLPPAMPFTFHETAVLEVFCTVAVNCLVLPVRTLALV